MKPISRAVMPTTLALAFLHSAGVSHSQVLLIRTFTPNQNIPDGGELIDTRSWDLPGAEIDSLRVGLTIAERSAGSGFSGDIYARLLHNQADGSAILINRAGKRTASGFGYADAGFDVTFDDNAANGDLHVYRQTLNGSDSLPIGGLLTGTWAPDGRAVDPDDVVAADPRHALLSIFQNKPVSGDWLLHIADLSSGGTHRLARWSLEVNARFAPAQVITLSGETLRPVQPGQNFPNPIHLQQNSTVDGSLSLSGTISGPGTLVKQGSGDLVLSGENSYSGGTIVENGRLIVQNSSGSATGTGPVDVFDAGTIGGNGFISGPLTIHSGGNIAPGASPGRLSLASAVFGPGGVYTWSINRAQGLAGSDPGWDLVNISGTLSITATAQNKFTIAFESLKLDNTAGPVQDFDTGRDYLWRIATAGGGISGFGPAAFLLDTSGFANDPLGGAFRIEQSGNDLNLRFQSAVPEPIQTAAASGLALLLFALIRRKRRDSKRVSEGVL